MGNENIGAPVIGEIQSKAVIIPNAIDTFPKILNLFSMEFSKYKITNFFTPIVILRPLFSREEPCPLSH